MQDSRRFKGSQTGQSSFVPTHIKPGVRKRLVQVQHGFAAYMDSIAIDAVMIQQRRNTHPFS